MPENALDEGELPQHALHHIPGHVRPASNQFILNVYVMKWVCVVVTDAGGRRNNLDGETNVTILDRGM
jgi:hypothetical protein